MSIRDLIADLLDANSPDTRPDSPPIRNADTRLVAGNSPRSPRSPARGPESPNATMTDLEAAAGDDWPEVRRRPEVLEALTAALETGAMRERGEIPSHYTQASLCAHCGPVWLWEGAPAAVQGCPWCFNRAAGRPIPRPG